MESGRDPDPEEEALIGQAAPPILWRRRAVVAVLGLASGLLLLSAATATVVRGGAPWSAGAQNNAYGAQKVKPAASILGLDGHFSGDNNGVYVEDNKGNINLGNINYAGRCANLGKADQTNLEKWFELGDYDKIKDQLECNPDTMGKWFYEGATSELWSRSELQGPNPSGMCNLFHVARLNIHLRHDRVFGLVMDFLNHYAAAGAEGSNGDICNSCEVFCCWVTTVNYIAYGGYESTWTRYTTPCNRAGVYSPPVLTGEVGPPVGSPCVHGGGNYIYDVTWYATRSMRIDEDYMKHVQCAWVDGAIDDYFDQWHPTHA